MSHHLAIVGATGVVGREFLQLLEQRSFPADRISLLASDRSAGTTIPVRNEAITVEAVTPQRLADVTLAVFSAGAQVSRDYAPVVVKAGGVVIDNSSAFRMDRNVPLVIPEINAQDLAHHNGIIANPNCTTIMLLMAVAPVHRAFPVKRIVVSTYQAASGAGLQAMQELRQQTCDYLDGKQIRPHAFPHPIAFNLFAHDSPVADNGYNGEENKVVNETRKILHEPDMAVAVTCVRVPVMRAHSESINLEFHDPVTPDRVREVLEAADGVKVVDDRERSHFPMPIEADGQDDVLVGRIRSDISRPDGRGIELFVCGDQLRKGAALNAMQIAEHLVAVGAGG